MFGRASVPQHELHGLSGRNEHGGRLESSSRYGDVYREVVVLSSCGRGVCGVILPIKRVDLIS
jgi:hypothetical protein